MRMVSMARLWLPYDFAGVKVVQKLTIRLKSNCQFTQETRLKNTKNTKIHSKFTLLWAADDCWGYN